MSRKNQLKEVEEVVQIEEEEEETTETLEEEEKIDPRIIAMIRLNRKQKISGKDKQTKIYTAMANIKIVRS